MEVRFDITELGVVPRRINAGDCAFAPCVSVIRREAETIAKRDVHTHIANVREAAIASRSAARVAERARLERATAAIPKIVRVGQAQSMQLTAKYKRMRQPEHGRREKVLVVHHIVERKAGVRTRRGQDLEERAVTAVSGIGIAAAIRIAYAEPRIEKVGNRLPASFGNKGSRTLCENSPTPVLNRAPDEEIELAVILRVEHVDVVRAVGADSDVVVIGGAEWRCTTVGFEHRATFVYIPKAEKAELADSAAAINGRCVGAVEEIDVEFAHGVGLIDAASRTRSEKSKVAGFGVEGKLRAVVAASYTGKAEVAYEALRDASVDQSRERFIFGYDLGSIEIRETAEPQLRICRKSEPHVSLSDEGIGVILAIAVRGIVGTSQAELTRRTGQNGGCRQIDNGVLCAFREPFESFRFLTEADAEE